VSKENRRRLIEQLSLGIRTDKPMDEQDVWLPGVQALEAEVEISPGVTTSVSVTGAEAFTSAGGADAYATLSALRAALESNDAEGVAHTLTDLETSRAQIVRTQAKTGLIMNRLDSADEALSTTALELDRRRSTLGDVDPFSALSELNQLSTTLQQAIAVARTTLGTGNNDTF